VLFFNITTQVNINHYKSEVKMVKFSAGLMRVTSTGDCCDKENL